MVHTTKAKMTISKTTNTLLWMAQVLLGASMAWAAFMKLFQPTEKLAAMWPWTAQVPPVVVKGTGIIDILAALGLLLPGLLHFKPRITSLAATGIVLLMVCAGIFHIVRGEVSVIGVNIGFALLAIFIAWGRRAEQ